MVSKYYKISYEVLEITRLGLFSFFGRRCNLRQLFSSGKLQRLTPGEPRNLYANTSIRLLVTPWLKLP